MNNNVKQVAIIALSIAFGAVGSYWLFRGDDLPAANLPSSDRSITLVKTRVDGKVKKVTKVTLAKEKGSRVVKIVEEKSARPNVKAPDADSSVSDDVDEENLTDLQKGVLKELQDALDANDLKRVRNALKKFVAKADKGGCDGRVPVCMRAKAVEALGWFGKDAAVDLIGFVADANEDVANDAFMHFEQALSDCELGDRERADLLKSTLSALTDAEQVDSLLSQLNDMRNSVKAQTASEILLTGSDTAKTKLQEQLETYFDEDVKDADSLEKWKAMNPDDPSDNEIYGAAK